MDNNEYLNSIMLEEKKPSIITVMGVGGAGCNAVNHMYELGIEGVTFMICNTDSQVLNQSPIDLKIQLGSGLGAGNNPDKGRQSAIESLDEIMIQFEQQGTKMVFITAGMGGGTGTGAAPVIAKAAKQHGILTVGITSLPFRTEGKKRVEQAYKGLDELKANVDSLVVIHNDNISKIYGQLPFAEAFGKADDILATAARGIAELITRRGLVNVDFADVNTVMHDSGMALMGVAKASGPDKIETVVNDALASPLLNQQNIIGSQNILLNIAYGQDNSLTFGDATRILDTIQRRVSKGVYANEANIIWGAGRNPSLEDDEIELTIVATGFNSMIYNTTSQAQKGAMIDETIPVEILNVPKKKRYEDIDKVWDLPAYVAQNKSLWKDPSQPRKAVQIKEEHEESNTDEGNGKSDLFSE